MIAGSLLLTIGIAGVSACTTSPSAPTFPPAPTVPVPDNYTRFTDETATFSISYPPDWELSLSQIDTLEDFVDEFFTGNSVDLSGTSVVFTAGRPTLTGHSPNVNVVAESLPEELNSDQYAEASIRGIEQIFESEIIHSQKGALVNGRRGQIFEASYDGGEISPLVTGRFRVITFVVVRPGEKIGWSVGCTGSDPLPVDFEETCNAILHSFELLD